MTASSGSVFTPIKWPDDEVARNGDVKPIWDDLNEFVKAFEESLNPGGDYQQFGLNTVRIARIIRQSDGEIVVRWSRGVGC